MKIITGFFIIMAFYFIGEMISFFIGNFIPGNIIGMLLLFISLHFKIISASKVRSVAQVLTKNMTLFFIPATVGLMEHIGLLKDSWITILVTTLASTLIVLATIGWIQQKMERKDS